MSRSRAGRADEEVARSRADDDAKDAAAKSALAAARAAAAAHAPGGVGSGAGRGTLWGFAAEDVALGGLFLALALATRLWNITDPRGVVFDETHFNKFSTWCVARARLAKRAAGGARTPGGHAAACVTLLLRRRHAAALDSGVLATRRHVARGLSPSPHAPVCPPRARPPSTTCLTVARAAPRRRYVSGHYFVDIHPPLAKLVYAAILVAFGFKGAGELNVKWWTNDGFIGTRDWELLYAEEYRTASGLLPYVPLRVAAALVGSALVLAMFASARALGLGRAPAAVAATLVLCETVTALQSRLILCDAFLYFFNVASFGASFASVRPGLSPAASLGWAAAVGLLLGCAFSVKLTAIGTIGTVGIHQALTLGRAWVAAGRPAPRARVLWWGAARAGVMLAAIAAVFFGLWTIHINILPYSGQGDTFSSPAYAATLYEKPPPGPRADVDPFACPNPANSWSDCGFSPMTEAQCLERGCCWDPSSNKAWCYHKGPRERPTLGWVWKVADVLRATNALNHGGAVMVHPFMSEWREWPLLGGKSVPFGSSTEGAPITALGNPGVHWPVAAAVAVASLGLAALGVLYAARGLAERAALVMGDADDADDKERESREKGGAGRWEREREGERVGARARGRAFEREGVRARGRASEQEGKRANDHARAILARERARERPRASVLSRASEQERARAAARCAAQPIPAPRSHR